MTSRTRTTSHERARLVKCATSRFSRELGHEILEFDFLLLFELLFLVERIADQRRDLPALMQLLDFGAGSDSTAGLATHGLQHIDSPR
jgi:hypothetical protein